jgi:hypothetical protein
MMLKLEKLKCNLNLKTYKSNPQKHTWFNFQAKNIWLKVRIKILFESYVKGVYCGVIYK